jgi:uncharacterized membrane protein YozB (DUF420 family)
MSKEIIYIRFLQISVLLLTIAIFYGVMQVKKGNIALHRKINISVLAVTALAVIGLVVTLFMGFKYGTLKPEESLLNLGPASMQTRISIHRCFSTPLFFSLCYTAYTGYTSQVSKHKRSIGVTSLFWLGTLITAWLFF